MAEDASEESQHFEQVLSRLDALMKRNQSAEPAEMMQSASPFEHQASDAEMDETLELVIPPHADEAPADAGISIDSHDVIPVLTEVYEVVLPAPASPAINPIKDTEAVLEDLLPRIQEIIEQALKSEMKKMRATLLPRIQEEVAEAVRSRLSGDHDESA